MSYLRCIYLQTWQVNSHSASLLLADHLSSSLFYTGAAHAQDQEEGGGGGGRRGWRGDREREQLRDRCGGEEQVGSRAVVSVAVMSCHVLHLHTLECASFDLL